jgi:hypothetical protein
MILRTLTSLVTGERAARTGNAEMLDDLVGYEGIKRTFLRSLGAKLLFGNSVKIIVPGSWLGRRVIAFLHSEYISKHPEARKADE